MCSTYHNSLAGHTNFSRVEVGGVMGGGNNDHDVKVSTRALLKRDKQSQ